MTEQPYKTLYAMLQELASDNGDQLNPEVPWPANAPALEQLAQSLTPDERTRLVNGERGWVDRLIADRPGLAPLDEWLDDAFESETYWLMPDTLQHP